MSKYIWQYRNSRGGWSDYEPKASDFIEGVYQEYKANRGKTDVRAIKSKLWEYQVDFLAMKQTNIQHEAHKIRDIRRIHRGYSLDANGNVRVRFVKEKENYIIRLKNVNNSEISFVVVQATNERDALRQAFITSIKNNNVKMYEQLWYAASYFIDDEKVWDLMGYTYDFSCFEASELVSKCLEGILDIYEEEFENKTELYKKYDQLDPLEVVRIEKMQYNKLYD